MAAQHRYLLALLLPCLAASLASAQWPTYQADIQHSGRTAVTIDPLQVSFKWSAPQGYSIPLIVGNTIYSMRNQQGIGSDTTSIRSFDLNTGGVNWTYSEKYTFPTQPTFQGGDVIYGAEVQATGTSSLFVLNAATGGVRYTVPFPAGVSAATAGMPVVHQDTGGVRRAFVVTNGAVRAFQLGTTSGSVIWSNTGTFSPGPIPTILGNSVLVSGPGKYYAYDVVTGTRNQFHNGNLSGGGNATIVADATNNRFYVLEAYSTSAFNALTAYSYVNNSTITQLWQRTDSAIDNGGQVAIGPDGKLYLVNNTTLSELNPLTGATLRFLPGQDFPNGVAPALSNGYLWVYEDETFDPGVSVFDLTTLTQVRHFIGGRGSSNSAYDGPGALAPNTFVLNYGNIYGNPGFDVYIAAVPEPATIVLGLGLAATAAYAWRRSRRRLTHQLDATLPDEPGVD